MTACIIGTVIKIGNKLVTIEDRLTKEQYVCETEGDEFLDLKLDDQGVFVGQYIGTTLKVKRLEIRKFLDPLYETDLYDASGKFTLIPVLNNPFTSVYLEYLEKQKELDKLAEKQRALDALTEEKLMEFQDLATQEEDYTNEDK